MYQRRSLCALALASLCFAPFARPSRADGAGDNSFDNVRRIPQPGVPVPDADRTELETGIAQLGQQIEDLRKSLSADKRDLLPDVQIYHNAARYALKYNEFFNANEIKTAKTLLQQGMERAAQLKQGQTPWTTQTGLVARGYVSKIDGSVQPYGLVVPASYDAQATTPHRLDIWYHGRGENLSELNFINDRQRNMGEFAPTDAFVLHPYGRFCNANRFAGEVDTWEALDAVKKHYRIDPNRLVVRGFSMGGAACWLFTTHYPGTWAVASPGAGFSETADFLKVYQNEPVQPTWYQKQLWHQYDSIDYAANLADVPVIAYSGEIDGQRQAATMMVTAAQAEGLTFTHIIGPKAGHFYEKEAKKEVARLVDEQAAKGNDPVPASLRFTTWTLHYNKVKWAQIDGLAHHWQRADLQAELADTHTLRATTHGITGLTFTFPSGQNKVDIAAPITLNIDSQKLISPHSALSERGTWTVHLVKDAKNGKWQFGEDRSKGLHKIHDLQGPIDDALMDSFVFVSPTGTAQHAKVDAWVKGEEAHAIEHWRRQFRGEARVKDDTGITSADIANSNLILWGDPGSNKILARIAAKLPIAWDAQNLKMGTMSYGADHHVPVLVYPNPLNPKRYVVLNSGFTYREYDYLNNARQTPKLPDYAIVDVDVPMSSRAPGGIVRAGFFGEHWELLPNDGQGSASTASASPTTTVKR